jgi:predicted small secreted protein
MRKFLSIAFAFALLISAVPLLGACHTASGFGQDVSDAGHQVSHDANHP